MTFLEDGSHARQSTGSYELCERFGGEPKHRAGNYLLLCPTHRDDRELSIIGQPGLTFTRHDYASLALEELIGTTGQAAPPIKDPLEELERILNRVRGETLSGVISTDDYPGSTLAAAVAERLNLPGPTTATNLLCQHKYHSRQAQRKLVPEAVPEFALIDTDDPATLPKSMSFPAFVKPTKSFFSVGAQRLGSIEQLARLQKRWSRLGAFFEPFERLLEHYTGLHVGNGRLLVEDLLGGFQVTLEGYAYGEEIHILGVVDSVMFPGTLAFERFEYPSGLPEAVQERMASIARTSTLR